jgi:hypothetical protein
MFRRLMHKPGEEYVDVRQLIPRQTFENQGSRCILDDGPIDPSDLMTSRWTALKVVFGRVYLQRHDCIRRHRDEHQLATLQEWKDIRATLTKQFADRNANCVICDLPPEQSCRSCNRSWSRVVGRAPDNEPSAQAITEYI